MRRRACLALALVALLAMPLAADEWSDQESGRGSDGDRYQKTLSKDVEGASYYELLAWCRELGLADTGDRKALRDRVLAHYRVRAAPEGAEKEARVEIVSARQTDYFTLEAVDESYVVLRGGVVVTIRDSDNEATHTIEAETVVYNQTTGRMTARGGARYTLSRGSEQEVFEGESLSFDTESMEGVFYNGSVTRDRTVGGSTMEFTFQGTSLSRLSNDTIILEDGSISSSDAADPNYRLRARKAWILADGEWAIQGATLEVGRVPVLYLPFFFYPGDEILFHPTLEVREREGTALHTTTYLVGQRKRKDDALSVLQISQGSKTEYARVRRGMFLTIDPDNRETVKNADTYLTLMADVYSRLGGMVGLQAAFPPRFSGRISLGVSRSLFKDTTSSGYTPYWDDPERGYVSVWNRSNVLGLDLPFRFGVESDLSLQLGLASAKASVKMYSDPYYPSDFYTRSEQIDWDALLGGATSSAATSSKVGSLTWTANVNANLGSLLKKALRADTATVTADLGAYISSRDVDTSGDELLAVDPARTFYYPLSLKAPSVSAQLKGTALSLSTAPKTKAADKEQPASNGGSAVPKENPGKGIRVPWEAEEDETTEEPEATVAERRLVQPSARADVKTAAEASAEEASTLRLTYSLTPRISAEYGYATGDWLEPEDVDLSTEYILMTAQSGASVGLNVSLWGGLVGLTSQLTAAGNVRSRFEGTAEVSEEDWDALLVTDYRATKLNLTQTATATVQPLLGVAALRGSSLTYSLGWTVLATTYDSVVDGQPVFSTVAGDFDSDAVTSHSLAANLVLKPADTPQTLSLTAALPPDDASFRGKAALKLWKSTTRVGLGVFEDEDEWVADPITISEQIEPFTWLSLTQDVVIDAEEGVLDKLGIQARIGRASASFSAARMAPVNPYGEETGAPEAFLPSNISFRYALPAQKMLLWKNRISVESTAGASWSSDLQAFANNKLTFSLSLSVSIYKFLTLKLTESSYNNRMYRYFPAYAEALGINWVNPLYDLLRSFNFANINDRYSSGFKMKKVSLSAVHEMKDWTFQIEYSGAPSLKTVTKDGETFKQYEWEPTLSFLLQWKPLPLVKARASADSSGLTYGD